MGGRRQAGDEGELATPIAIRRSRVSGRYSERRDDRPSAKDAQQDGKCSVRRTSRRDRAATNNGGHGQANEPGRSDRPVPVVRSEPQKCPRRLGSAMTDRQPTLAVIL